MQLNYRPLSVLPVISKICERHVHVTFLSWLQKFRLLIENQSAYLKNHSCVTALIDITDTLLLKPLIIHKPKTKEFTTVKEVLICGLN